MPESVVFTSEVQNVSSACVPSAALRGPVIASSHTSGHFKTRVNVLDICNVIIQHMFYFEMVAAYYRK